MTEERKSKEEGGEECDHRKGDSHSRPIGRWLRDSERVTWPNRVELWGMGVGERQ